MIPRAIGVFAIKTDTSNPKGIGLLIDPPVPTIREDVRTSEFVSYVVCCGGYLDTMEPRGGRYI